MTKLVAVSEAKAILTSLLHELEDEDVVFTRHGRPAALMMSPARYEALVERIEDLEDRLSIYERENLPMGLDKLKAELGLAAEED